ncbi:hypothetical protein SARC_00279, partial [Sphaeroforma arctica JP610]
QASNKLEVIAPNSGYKKAIGLFPKRNPSLSISVQTASNSALNHFHGETAPVSDESDQEIDSFQMKDLVEFRQNLTRAQAKGILSWMRLQKVDRRRILESMIRLQAIESTMRVEMKMKSDETMVNRMRICGEYIKLHEDALSKLNKTTHKRQRKRKDAEIVVDRKKSNVSVPALPGTYSDRVVDITMTATPSKLDLMENKSEKKRDRRHVPRTRLRHVLPLPSLDKWADFLQ